MKDFKDSYEQKRWEFAVRTHAASIVYRDNARFETTKVFWQHRIDELEARHPQLREKKHA